MKYLNKKILICAVIILVLLATYLLIANWFASRKINNTDINQNNTQNSNNQATTLIDNKLSNRDIAIKEALTSPDKLLRRTQINGETYLLTGYDDVFYGDNAKENKPGQKFGGIIVFKLENDKPVFFWESEENINRDAAGFGDINNDGIPEIVWGYDLGVTGRNNAFYVYKFIGNGFRIVTPVDAWETVTSPGTVLKYSRTLLSGDSGLTYMEDIDKDGIQEIIVGDWKGNIGDNAGGKDIKIYKYDGDKYYLWKEETTGDGTPTSPAP